MTHTLFTAEESATVAAKLVGADLNLAALISRDFESDFGGGSGSTVQVTVPGSVKASRRDARDLTTPLVQSTIVEQTIPVTLDELVYSNVPLAVGHYDLDLQSFAGQVLRPQARAIAIDVETQVAATLQSTPETETLTYDAAKPSKIFTAIRRQLRNAGVSADETLLAAVGADVYADLLDSDADVEADKFVKARGFSIYESTRLAADEIVAFVPSAFALVVRAPSIPDGVPFGATIRDSGFALTALQAFSAETATNRSIVQALVAVQAMPLAVDTETGEVELVEHAGAVRVLTAA